MSRLIEFPAPMVSMFTLDFADGEGLWCVDVDGVPHVYHQGHWHWSSRDSVWMHKTGAFSVWMHKTGAFYVTAVVDSTWMYGVVRSFRGPNSVDPLYREPRVQMTVQRDDLIDEVNRLMLDGERVMRKTTLALATAEKKGR